MPEPERDLYADLGVCCDASAEQVRRAYRALARPRHPDLKPELGAADRFGRVAAAFAVLSDPVRRAAYDLSRTASDIQDGDTDAAASARVYGDYAPAGEPAAFDDYAPVPDYAPDPPPPLAPQPAPPRPAPPPRSAAPAMGPPWAASRYVSRTAAPFPAGWAAGRIDHRRLGGRLLLKVWRLAPLPANRVGIGRTSSSTARRSGAAGGQATGSTRTSETTGSTRSTA
ncbi:DnaJ domain-containing protein [Pseudonocardia parietis]|nr:DnaJ domain-containing protein [Pseudonocardia parietis]